MDKNDLCGLDDRFICRGSFSAGIHEQAEEAFKALQADANQQGFDLAIASGYRSFSRQLAIWNAKASGQRVVLDSHGQPIDIAKLDAWSLVQAILRWSALPGASRHHWGTDIDVYDKSAVGADYAVQLTVDEVTDGGPFAALHDWIDGRIESNEAYGFFRPYQQDLGGIAPERWHLSYAPVSKKCQQALSIDMLVQLVGSSPMELSDTVIAHIDEIYERFVAVSFECYPR